MGDFLHTLCGEGCLLRSDVDLTLRIKLLLHLGKCLVDALIVLLQQLLAEGASSLGSAGAGAGVSCGGVCGAGAGAGAGAGCGSVGGACGVVLDPSSMGNSLLCCDLGMKKASLSRC